MISPHDRRCQSTPSRERPTRARTRSERTSRTAHEGGILAANPIDHHARDRVYAVVAAAALRTSARDGPGGNPRYACFARGSRAPARKSSTRPSLVQGERVSVDERDACFPLESRHQRPPEGWAYASAVSRPPRVLQAGEAVAQVIARRSTGGSKRWRRAIASPSARRQAAAAASWCLWSFKRLWVAVIRRHSVRTADLPRRWKRSMPRLNLVCANTGSISCWRCR
jgi:hypothetical protein